MPDFRTTDQLSDRELLMRMQTLRSQYPGIELSRGFGIVQGYLMLNDLPMPPADTTMNWIENIPNQTPNIVTNSVEEEVELG